MKKMLCMMLAGMMMFPATAYAADESFLTKEADGKYDVSFEDVEDGKEYMLWVLKGQHDSAEDASFSQEDVLYIDQKTAEDGKVEFNDFLPMEEADSTVVLTGQDMEPQVVGLMEAAEASDVIAEGTHGDNLTWVLTGDGTLTISGTGVMKSSSYPWAAYKPDIKKLVVNEGVTTIGDIAFSNCDGLNRISLSNSVTTIGTSAFYHCDSLDSVTLGSSVETIGDYTFSNCAALGSIVIPDGVKTINQNAFSYCASLSSVTLGNGVETIGDSAFYDCDALSSITFGSGMETIGNNAFRDCDALRSVDLGSGLKTIGEYAFYDCGVLSNVAQGSGVETIGEYAFYNCDNLSSMTLGVSMKVIGNYAFAHCNRLNSISIPAGVETIGKCAFNHCTGLSSVTLSEGLKTIGEYAFAGCNGLSSITLPAGLTTIDNYAFSECKNLIKVVSNNEVETIGKRAFYNCESLKNFNFSTSLKTIGEQAFERCGLTEVVIPASVTAITGNPFIRCKYIESIKVDAANPVYDSRNNCNAIIETATDTLQVGCKDTKVPGGILIIGVRAFAFNDNLKSITLPDGLQKIEEEAFFDCNYLEEIDIPGSVTEIADSGVGSCYRMKKITLHEGLKEIGADAFSSCEYIEEITIPGSVTSIGKSAFDYCTHLHKITICEGVTSIGDSMFVSCPNIKIVILPSTLESIKYNAFYDWRTEPYERVYYYGTAADWEDILISAGNDKLVNTNRTYVVAGTKELIYASGTCGDNLTWKINTDGVMTISGRGAMAEYDYSDVPWYDAIIYMVKEIIVEEGVTTISGNAFSRNENVEKITLPSTLKSIGNYNFENYEPTLEEVYFNGTAAQWDRITIGSSNDDLLNATLYIGGVATSGIVSRVYGLSRCDTAMKAADVLKENLGVSKFSTVVVANAENFADALAGSYLAAEKDAPILLTNARSQASVQNYIKNNLKSGGRVYVLGGKLAVAESFDAGLSGFRVTRLFGTSRYDTNLEILKAAGVSSSDEILVCTGTNFADSLSVSSAGKPILLVGNSLTAAQKDFLKGTSGEFRIIGGPLAVNANIEAELDKMGDVERIYGTSRFDTSVAVAKAFFNNPDQMVLAYAQNFPDGLSGGPLAYSVDAPLVLTQNGKHAAAMTYASQNGIKDGYVMGGIMLISDDTAKTIFGLGKAQSIIVK